MQSSLKSPKTASGKIQQKHTSMVITGLSWTTTSYICKKRAIILDKNWLDSRLVASESSCYCTECAISENITHQYSPHVGVASNQCKDWPLAGKESRQRSGLIINIYILLSPWSISRSSLHSNFCSSFPIYFYHQSIHPTITILSNSKIWKEICSSISNTGSWITKPRMKGPFGKQI